MRILYHIPLSPESRMVRLALAEKRIPFEMRVEKVWERREEFLAINPACSVPVLHEENGLILTESYAICEYLDEAYPDLTLFGETLAQRAEVRRLVSWFEIKFNAEVSQNLLYQKQLKRLMGQGNPETSAIRAGYTNLKAHMDYIGSLSESRAWLAGASISLADFAAAAHLSALDFIGDVDWRLNDAAKDWYARMKSRPAFRPLLADRVSGITPPEHYANPDF